MLGPLIHSMKILRRHLHCLQKWCMYLLVLLSRIAIVGPKLFYKYNYCIKLLWIQSIVYVFCTRQEIAKSLCHSPGPKMIPLSLLISTCCYWLVGLLRYIRVRERPTISGIFQPCFLSGSGRLSATLGIILRLSPSKIILHIEGIEPAVTILKISLLHHYPREPSLCTCFPSCPQRANSCFYEYLYTVHDVSKQFSNATRCTLLALWLAISIQHWHLQDPH